MFRVLEKNELMKFDSLIKDSRKAKGICHINMLEKNDVVTVYLEIAESVEYNKTNDNIKHLVKDDKHIYYILNEIRKQTGYAFFKVARRIKKDADINIDVHDIRICPDSMMETCEYVLCTDEETNEEAIIYIEQLIVLPNDTQI